MATLDDGNATGAGIPIGSWYTLAPIRTDWRDAPASDTVLQQLLDTAKMQVLEFGNGFNWRRNPAYGGGDFPGDYPAYGVPPNLLLAQRTQVRNLWNANRVNPANGDGGGDSFTLSPFPLDWVVKAMIRPKRVLGTVG